MTLCTTVLCVIDPDRRGARVLARAADHARRQNARLIVAHVVDHHTGFESDHVPFLSPRELNGELALAALRRIQAMLPPDRAETPVIVEVGSARQTVIKLARDNGADLVMVEAHSPFGMQTAQARKPPHHYPFDVLTVQEKRTWNPMQLLRGDHGGAGSRPVKHLEG